MRGDVPQSALVEQLLDDAGATSVNGSVEFFLQCGKETGLVGLAEAFRSVVRPGARYSVNSYRYVCPRVATALDRFQRTLSAVWREA